MSPLLLIEVRISGRFFIVKTKIKKEGEQEG
jgi:hypothetical protein